MTRDEVLLARGTPMPSRCAASSTMPAGGCRYMPQGAMARDIYDAMETARCEAVGARHMPGTAGNIDAKIAQRGRGARDMTRSAGGRCAAGGGRGIPDPPSGDGRDCRRGRRT
jgi:cobaltochelatase CobT